MPSTAFAAPPSLANGSARVTWRSGTWRSTGGARPGPTPSPPPPARRPLYLPPSELCRRLSDPVDDRLALAGGLVEPAWLGVAVDHQGLEVDADEARAVEGVAADHPFAGFLRPHLIEDEVAVRVGDQAILIDLHRLDPVRMVADHQVGPVVNRQVADLARVVGRDPGTGDREEFVLLAPVEGDHHDIGLGPHQVD